MTVTGSEGAGRDIASTAGKHIKKSVLELGGSDAFIVLPSADLPRAVATAVKARIVNNGQSCIAAKRFIVADAIYDAFVRELRRRRWRRCGSAIRRGPTRSSGRWRLASIRDGVAEQVERVGGGGRAPARGRAAPRRAGVLLPADGARRRPARRAGRARGGVRPGRRALPRAPTSTRRSRSPTARRSVWARRRGRAIAPRRSGWRASSRPAACSSTAWSRPTRASRSGASSARVTGASWASRPARVRQHQDGADGGSS